MAQKKYGQNLNTKLKQKQTQETSTESSVIRIEYMVDSASVTAQTPALGSALSGNPGYALRTVDTETQQAAGIVKLILTYEASSSTGSLPGSTAVYQGSVEEVDIRQHPDFADWADEWDSVKEAFLPTSSKYGITAYKAGTMTVTKTDYFTTQPSVNVGSLGTLDSPGGGLGSSQNWLIIGISIRPVGSYFVKETTYLYSAKPYNSDIYD